MIFDIHPFLSIFYSLLIINGLYNLSKIIYESTYLKFLSNYSVSGQIVVFFLVVNFLAISSYIFFILFGINKLFLQVILISLILIGFYKPSLFSDILTKLRIVKNKSYLILLLLIFAYFILSLMPISDPDSLDYHLTVPYLSLLNERFFIEKEWISSQLSGAGEALIIIALSINAYKFSSILQFSGLAAIIILILNLKINKEHNNFENKILICLAMLCIPSFLFLTFTAKPQLFSIASNFVAFLLTFFVLPEENNKKNAIFLFGFISFLCLSATQYKFSFFLSSGIIIFFAMYEIYKKNLIFLGFIINLLLTIVIIFPREYYDYVNFSSDIIKNFFQPVTDNYISQNFTTSLRHGSGNPRYLPYWLFLPIYLGKLTFGVITEILGLSVLIFLVNFKLKKVTKIFIASMIFFIVAIFLSQPIGRFFIEPFLWLMTGSVYYLGLNKNFFFKFLQKAIIINSLIIIVIIVVTLKNFLPGIISVNNYKNILYQYAEGYKLYEWFNKNLPDNSIVLTSHRSYLFSKYPFVSYEFRLYSSNSRQLEYFTNLVIKKKPTHLLYNGLDHNIKTDVLKNCRGKLIKFEKKASQTATRNPLSRNNIHHDGYIYEIDSLKLKKCKY